MKLNLGCGHRKKDGYLNIDRDPLCKPDRVVDLETTPWPFEQDTFTEIVADHVLEHLGESTSTWLKIWQEIWRVSRDGAVIHITVPHPRHDNFMVDPTHVRPIFPGTIAMFDQTRNIRDHENDGQETKLGLMCGIDLELTDVQWDLCEPWASAHRDGKISVQELTRDLTILNNVCLQIRMQARIIKPPRGLEWLRVFRQAGESG